MTNRLIHEKSPYLQQHAHNPVDWYPWGEEAFTVARGRELPIFLSIGYSTCHWCHVMERESFEDETVAQFLNEHFIPIKVDREERPDVDEVYMAAVQAISGGGGWPMSVFLTPDLKPFYAGTYYPPKPAFGRPSFSQLIERISELWQTDRTALVESSDELTEALKESRAASAEVFTMKSAERCYRYFHQSFDEQEGGFGGAPKFPRPVQFDFLLNYWYRTGTDRARDMSLRTLRRMALGGLYDHVGGGFHRYSVDRYWRVSHFEKMLYDQAQLACSYLDAWQITQDEFYSAVARGICDYVLRDLTSPEGGFYSAEDADSEGEEGKFYVWTKSEIHDLLGARAALVIERFGITEAGNFEHGKNVLHTSTPRERLAGSHDQSVDGLQSEIHEALKTLFAARAHRVRPHMDDKVLTSWNGLMIGAMARVGFALEEERYLDAAIAAGEFVWNTLRTDDALLHRWRDGEAKIPAMLDDYAFSIDGYLKLYEATFEVRWLDRAIELQHLQDAHLWDASEGGYFTTASRDDIIVRRKNGYDGAEPSGNSVSALNLIKLAVLTENDAYRDKAEKLVRYFGQVLTEHPYAMPELAVAGMQLSGPSEQVVFSGDTAEVRAMRVQLAKSFSPNIVVLSSETAHGSFARELPNTGTATAYFCREFVCELPVHDAAALLKLVRARERSLTNA